MKQQLEQYIEGNGLAATIALLSEICLEKASKVEYVWQDADQQQRWKWAGQYLHSISEGKGIKNVA